MNIKKDRQNVAFEEVEHTADLALRIYGADLAALFINAAQGLKHLIVPDKYVISPKIEKQVDLVSIDVESLLVEWLNELAYWAESELLVFEQVDVQRITDFRLKAIIWGDHVRELKKHIKAVTYHNLEIIETESGLTATVVFDV